MDLTKPPRWREPGNAECVALLEKWLREARRGRMVHVGLVGCIAPDELVLDAIGTANTEHDILDAIEDLKQRIHKGISNRIAPFDPNLPRNQVSFNIAAGVVSFDFIAWLIGAEMHRKRYKVAEPLQVCFYQANGVSNLRTSRYHEEMFNKVAWPLVAAIGGSVNQVVGGKSDFSLTHNEITAACLSGEEVPRLTPIAPAVEAVERVMHDYPQAITITLRETDAYPERNSDVAAWLKFATDLQAKGEDVIFVRDTAKADEELENFPTFPPASRDLHVRLALYKKAKCNLYVANGPATLNWHLETPFLMFSQLDPNHHGRYAPAFPEWWKPRMGIEAGEQFPWFSAQQKIIWQRDAYENICAAWEAA